MELLPTNNKDKKRHFYETPAKPHNTPYTSLRKWMKKNIIWFSLYLFHCFLSVEQLCKNHPFFLFFFSKLIFFLLFLLVQTWWYRSIYEIVDFGFFFGLEKNFCWCL